MSNIQIKEFHPSEFTEAQLNQLNKIPLVEPFLTRKEIRKKVTQNESRKQAIGLFFVGSALIGLAHLCSTEMSEGTGLWGIYLLLIVLMYLFVTRIMWNNSVDLAVRKLTNEQVATEMEKAKLFLLANPFFYRNGNELYENVPKFKRFLALQEKAQADFRHLQTRVDGYRQQMEHLINQPHNPNIDPESQKQTLEAMEVRLRIHSDALFMLHDNLQPLNSYMDRLLMEKANVKSMAKKDYNSGRLEGEYSSPILFDSTESQGINIEKNMSRCLSVVQNTGIKWRQELAKMRGIPDPTINGNDNSQKSLSNQQEQVNKEQVSKEQVKEQQESQKQIQSIKKQSSYKSGLFQASPINSAADIVSSSNDQKDDSKNDDKNNNSKDGSERLKKDIAI